MTITTLDGRRPRGEQGDTLLEILISVVVLSMAVVAVVAGLTTTATSAAEHRNLTALNTLLKSFAESVTNQVEEQAAVAWDGCAATPTYYNTPANGLNETPPSGYTGYSETITAVQFWNTSTNSFASSCTTDSGLQLLTAVVVSPSAGSPSDTMTFVVRNPAYVSSDAGI
ncbi:MAG: type IV pilus modification PilV family protein [Acidimicrobiales bacterium]